MRAKQALIMTLLLAPFMIGVTACVALLEIGFAVSGHWVWFWVIAGVEAYILLASVMKSRYAQKQRSKTTLPSRPSSE